MNNIKSRKLKKKKSNKKKYRKILTKKKINFLGGAATERGLTAFFNVGLFEGIIETTTSYLLPKTANKTPEDEDETLKDILDFVKKEMKIRDDFFSNATKKDKSAQLQDKSFENVFNDFTTGITDGVLKGFITNQETIINSYKNINVIYKNYIDKTKRRVNLIHPDYHGYIYPYDIIRKRKEDHLLTPVVPENTFICFFTPLNNSGLVDDSTSNMDVFFSNVKRKHMESILFNLQHLIAKDLTKLNVLYATAFFNCFKYATWYYPGQQYINVSIGSDEDTGYIYEKKFGNKNNYPFEILTDKLPKIDITADDFIKKYNEFNKDEINIYLFRLCRPFSQDFEPRYKISDFFKYEYYIRLLNISIIDKLKTTLSLDKIEFVELDGCAFESDKKEVLTSDSNARIIGPLTIVDEKEYMYNVLGDFLMLFFYDCEKDNLSKEDIKFFLTLSLRKQMFVLKTLENVLTPDKLKNIVTMILSIFLGDQNITSNVVLPVNIFNKLNLNDKLQNDIYYDFKKYLFDTYLEFCLKYLNEGIIKTEFLNFKANLALKTVESDNVVRSNNDFITLISKLNTQVLPFPLNPPNIIIHLFEFKDELFIRDNPIRFTKIDQLSLYETQRDIKLDFLLVLTGLEISNLNIKNYFPTENLSFSNNGPEDKGYNNIQILNVLTENDFNFNSKIKLLLIYNSLINKIVFSVDKIIDKIILKKTLIKEKLIVTANNKLKKIKLEDLILPKDSEIFSEETIELLKTDIDECELQTKKIIIEDFPQETLLSFDLSKLVCDELVFKGKVPTNIFFSSLKILKFKSVDLTSAICNKPLFVKKFKRFSLLSKGIKFKL